MGTALVLYNPNQQAQPPRRTGNVTLYSDAMTEAICAHLRRGATRRAAALAAGISYQTFYNWLNDETVGLTFFDAVSRAEAEGEIAFTDSVAKAALGTTDVPGDYKAAIELMKRRYPAWRDQIDVRKIDPAVLMQMLQQQHEATTDDQSQPAIEDAFDVL